MSEYIVTARKWRPMKFEDVVGQDHVTGTLRNALQHKRLAHAYLFSGPRGVGKTTTARLLAKAVNCTSPMNGNPDNSCEICREIADGRSFDVMEIDGASNRGVEEIRTLREAVRYPPVKGSYKTYIIDEVHMLTKEAFNALLKTLEEPPAHALFIFATTEIHRVPATILSRCQRFEFRRLSTSEISGNLRLVASSEEVEIDDDALLMIAKKGDGSLRDAQSLFDQLVSSFGKKIMYDQILSELRVVDLDAFFKLTDFILRKDTKSGLELIDEIITHGFDLKEFLLGFMEHLRNILVVKSTGSTNLVETSDANRTRYQTAATKFSVPDLLRLHRTAAETESSLRWSTQPRFKVEAGIVQMISMDNARTVSELVQRIDDLKKKVRDEKVIAAPHAVPVEPASLPAVNKSVERELNIAPGKISGEAVQTQWPQFLSEVRQKRISLGSAIEGTTVMGVRADAVRVGCADEFVLSSIKRNKQALQEILQGVMHARVFLEPELDPHAAKPRSTETEPAPTVGTAPPEEHPVVKALIRELGAEPL